jgi:hypothetical protein
MKFTNSKNVKSVAPTGSLTIDRLSHLKNIAEITEITKITEPEKL